MPKSTLSRDALQTLECLWAEGVHSHRTEVERLRVKQVAAATGLAVEQVKVWIYNRNRKKRKNGKGPMKRMQPSGALETRGRPAPGGETSSAVAHTPPLGSPEEASSRAAGGREDSHRDLDSPEPEQEQEEEEEEEEEEGEGSGRSVDHRQDKDLDPDLEDQDHDQESNQHQDRHQAIATELMQAVEEQVQKLQTCNCEVAVMVYNHSSGALYTTGTPRGLDFLNSQTPAVHWQFSGAMSNSSTQSSCS